jgi:large subunit ribosomal protein L18
MSASKRYNTLAIKRALRVRGKLHGTAERPRLTVYRSNKHIYVQVINDDSAQTLVTGNEQMLAKLSKKPLTGTKTERAQQIAAHVAEELKKAKITKLCFDRGSYRYHGRLKAIAETLRTAGINV